MASASEHGNSRPGGAGSTSSSQSARNQHLVLRVPLSPVQTIDLSKVGIQSTQLQKSVVFVLGGPGSGKGTQVRQQPERCTALHKMLPGARLRPCWPVSDGSPRVSARNGARVSLFCCSAPSWFRSLACFTSAQATC